MRILKSYLLLSLILVGVASLFVTFPIVPVKGEVPWKNQGPEWYYDTLNASQRQKIRQAMDYAVPREQIGQALIQGYAVSIPSPIGVNFKGVYEPSIGHREFNLTKSKKLLKEVFGYEYNATLNSTNEITKQTNIPYFTINLLCSTSVALPRQAGLTSSVFNRIGIDTRVDYMWSSSIYDILQNQVGTGYDHENGGYDAVFLGYPTSPDPIYNEYYDIDAFLPLDNRYWIEDGPATSGKWTEEIYPNITALWTDIYKTLDPAERTPMLKEYQQWCYDNIPTVILYQEQILWAMNENLKGYDLYHGIQQQICNWTINNTNSCSIGLTANYVIESVNPLLENSFSLKTCYSNTHVALSRRRGEYNLTHAYPWLAKNWTKSTDGLTWTVNLREGNKWSDGENITAEDVVFTYKAVLDESLKCPDRVTLLNIMGNASDNIVANGDYQVIFRLPKLYTYTETVLFGTTILPEHQLAAIPYTDWKIHKTNTGDIPIVASGPYVMQQYTGNNEVELRSNPYYNQTSMGHDPNAVGGGNWIPDPKLDKINHFQSIIFDYVNHGSIAITGLLDGKYIAIDKSINLHHYLRKEDIISINDSTETKVLVGHEWMYRELGLNHYSSIWGMNPHDPREMYQPDPFNFYSEFRLLLSNPIIFIGLIGTLLVVGGFVAFLVELYYNKKK